MLRWNINSFILIGLCLLLRPAGAQDNLTVGQYIDRYKDIAMEEMRQYRIPASITLAQGILESSSGNSRLAREANNHFGIKCHKGWTGKTFHQDDDEKNECFRKYGTAEESYKDHSVFLSTRDRYSLLFDLDIMDYKGWAHGLKQAGYATNPRYPELLIRIIEENDLTRFDREFEKRGKAGGDETREEGADVNAASGEAVPEFEFAGRGGIDRVLFRNNGKLFILAREEDDIWKIADEFGIYAWQVREYNELKNSDLLIAGEKVYLERKKRKSELEKHTALEGETLRDIAQDYGVRLGSLARRNGLEPGDRLKEGMIIRLR